MSEVPTLGVHTLVWPHFMCGYHEVVMYWCAGEGARNWGKWHQVFLLTTKSTT